MNDVSSDESLYAVVVNEEGFYSVWAVDRPLPAGWSNEGTTGTEAACLDRIEQVWTDMRPRSIRERDARASARET
jgi:MbtH protein